MEEKYLMESALNDAQENGQKVRLFLANGVQMVGKVHGFDRDTIALKCGAKVKYVCRSRLSTMEVEE